jgi:hypothetical protein
MSNNPVTAPHNDTGIAPNDQRGAGFNANVTNEVNPFQGVDTAASLGVKEARTLEDYVQPRVGDVYVDKDASAPRASAGDTITGVSRYFDNARFTLTDHLFAGATSKDVHDHYGHPGSGMTSKELHHNGRQTRDRYRVGTPAAIGGDGVIPKDESEIER